ncbi:oxysterol-binding protein-related protein 9 [Atheta coriaria]|uniref:oxysterol-binding protein-related protein 9 n=1 Tax=Dalotia coriaria TaxID=877792 RepID=UPI0031F40D9A
MAVLEGSLSKWTNVMKGWQYRYFVLDATSGLLSYYTSKEKMTRGVRRGCVRLKGAVIGIDDEDSTFTITVDHKTFHFQAKNAVEREQWVKALEDTIYKHANNMRWGTAGSSVTIKDFDNKVSEADAYLQLMIDQTKLLEERIQTIMEEDEKMKCQVILDHANVMLDNIKHSIVLLQIAKNTAHPINGIYPVPTTTNTGLPTTAVTQPNIVPMVEIASECIENARRHAAIVAATTTAVPETSYSSSEGEDDFFDANDFSSQTATPTTVRQFNAEEQPQQSTTTNSVYRKQSTTSGEASLHNQTHQTTPDDDIDYDALHEDDTETDVLLDQQGSVIKHMIGQVKIGMDLTKVVLPTFILERRSLLEMYADYFAHPDIFVGIADQKDPRDRMVQVVRWYLSSYHAGRKSCVAKKPYNPILGETFTCHWDVYQNKDPNCRKVHDGPVPWASEDQLTFVAEQVSHHPPISAFYAEHYNKRITFNAYIYTKSKFLGLSICVYNIGCGIVNVLDHDEQYVVTFPNGYGRSILTVPWIELGGSVTITCAKTGYSSNIEFLTKPFYGNKKHKITADVFAPNDKKPFLSINGEWNGVMEAKWNDKEPEEFIDVHKLEIVRKQVRPISQQTDNESRRLWKDVTAGLKYNNIDRATQAKFELEQKQRNEAKDRKANNEEWETNLFKKSLEDDNWLYTNSLQARLSKSANS